MRKTDMLKRGFYPLVGLLVLVLFLAVGLHQLLDRSDDNSEDAEGLSLTDFLSAGSEHEKGFAKARPDYVLSFPGDHLAHPAFRSEWWYLNGNLQHRDDPQQRFGFQFTIFRQALATQEKTTGSGWLTPQFYMGHTGLGVFSQGRHLTAERFSRQGPGLAGTEAEPLSVWLEDWRLQAEQSDDLFPATVSAGVKGAFSYRLHLVPEKPRVYQGEEGYSPKREEPGFASHYYSYTRLRVEGELKLDGETIPVSGTAWYDHEWSSNILAEYQTGWDWFSLQLEDGRDLVFMELPARPGSGKRNFRQVALFDVTGKHLSVDAQLIQLEVRDHWRSPSGIRWPSGWRLQIPEHDLDLTITPRQKNQENNLSVRYWEGAVKVTGSHNGQGYVELTGYE
ncbi:lipocalin-like domain-containing protein [Pontibacterium granulatum]|uniref:lipocalin-like domain-containing protein n=1 Tax=Pontibacterium granulatum TaxID=2036029 RepID=UPI00249CF340|nr:lipocalin-like domain-containing protein [Pontibacterium granulatum]MDI3324467.1 lipocalin-like domain-containing protein [Pontibacterium granulatum]